MRVSSRKDFSKIEFPHPAYFQSKPFARVDANMLAVVEAKLKLIFFLPPPRSPRILARFIFSLYTQLLSRIKILTRGLMRQPRFFFSSFFLRQDSISRVVFFYYTTRIKYRKKIRGNGVKNFDNFFIPSDSQI